MTAHKKNKTSILNKYFSFLHRRTKGDRFLFHIVLLSVFISLFFVLYQVNERNLTSVPSSGGTLVEGIVGTPRFVNPVLAITRSDHDMVSLIYSGLVKLNEDGNLVPDLAEKIEVQEDGRTYHITLKQGIKFHNGEELTARDVAYTISLIQDPDLKSPLRGNWDSVLVEELGEYELNIILEEEYTPFIENLTVGILPRALWNDLPTEQIPFSQNNTQPIGTGPYMIDDVLRNKSGLITSYKLTASPYYSKEQPNIDTLVFNFYQNEEELLTALQNEEISSTPSLSPDNLKKVDTQTYNIIKSPLPRTFSIFFNQNKSTVLRDKAVRKALQTAINKHELVNEVVHGYGIPINSPIPPGFNTNSRNTSSSTNPNEEELDNIEEAKSILRDGGWKEVDEIGWQKEYKKETLTLSITLSTANTPLFDKTAQYIEAQWKKLGVQVTTDQYEQTDLVQSIIRPREFEALLFGNDVSRSLDLYPFWHSSQKNDPGLNISQYTNIDTDSLLEKIQKETDSELRSELINKFTEIIMKEIPAIFLYTPTFNYVLDSSISTPPFKKLDKPSDRFANIAKWHINADKLWPIFGTQ